MPRLLPRGDACPDLDVRSSLRDLRGRARQSHVAFWVEPDRLAGQSCVVAGGNFATVSPTCEVKGQEIELGCKSSIPSATSRAIAIRAKKSPNPPSAAYCVRDDVLTRVVLSRDLDIASCAKWISHLRAQVIHERLVEVNSRLGPRSGSGCRWRILKNAWRALATAYHYRVEAEVMREVPSTYSAPTEPHFPHAVQNDGGQSVEGDP